MKGVHRFRVVDSIEVLAPLIAAAGDAGLRVGWLELGEPEVPRGLAEATQAGLAQTVIAGDRLTMTACTRKGPAVISDLLRQYFLGCDVVLVAGEIEADRLQSSGDGWRITTPSGGEHRASTQGIISSWQRPVRGRVEG